MLTRELILNYLEIGAIPWITDPYLTNKTVSILQGTQVFSIRGSRSVLFRRGKWVYGICEIGDKTKLILSELEATKHIPPVDILEINEEYYVYRMPIYKVYNTYAQLNINPTRLATFTRIGGYVRGTMTDDSELCKDVKAIIRKAEGYRVSSDVLPRNIGWVRNTPVLFDIVNIDEG